MKKLLFCSLVLITLLSSCGAKGRKFEEKDLEGFLTSLENHNFTVNYTYDIVNNGSILYNVTSTFQINGQEIYHEVLSRYPDDNEIKVTTQKYLHYEDGKYYKYLYQNDKTDGTEVISVSKNEIEENLFTNEIRYGIDYIFYPDGNYTYDVVKGEYVFKTITIKIDGHKILVNNTNVNTNTGNKNFKATYSKIDATKIGVPSFVRKYKGDIIPGM